MKKRKFKGLFIFLVIVLLFTIFFQTSSPLVNSKKFNTEFNNILSTSINNNDARVVDIAMLGAHDAFTSGINHKSKVDPNESNALLKNKAVNMIGKGVLVRLAKSQNANAKELLNAGVRYLDVRVTKENDTYYTMHSYISNTLEYYLKDVVDFLDANPGEFIIFDIQHFYCEVNRNYGCSKEEYEDLFNFIKSVKNSSNKSLFDYVYYNSNTSKINELTYGMMTKNKTTAGAIILAKTFDFDNVYVRDSDATYNEDALATTNTIRSYWHNKAKDNEMYESMEKELEYLKTYDYSNYLVVNQAQKTAFRTDAGLINSLVSWSLLDMGASFNAKSLDEEKLMESFKYMPIYMVDNATTNKNNFNKTINSYIMNYNVCL